MARQSKYYALEQSVKRINRLLEENKSDYRIGISNQNYRYNVGQCKPEQLQSDGWQESTNVRTLQYNCTLKETMILLAGITTGIYLLTNNKAIL